MATFAGPACTQGSQWSLYPCSPLTATTSLALSTRRVHVEDARPTNIPVPPACGESSNFVELAARIVYSKWEQPTKYDSYTSPVSWRIGLRQTCASMYHAERSPQPITHAKLHEQRKTTVDWKLETGYQLVPAQPMVVTTKKVSHRRCPAQKKTRTGQRCRAECSSRNPIVV